MSTKRNVFFLSCVLAAALIDFVGTMVESGFGAGQDMAETMLYLLGYVLLALTLAFAIIEVRKRKSAAVSTGVALITMLIRFAFDIITFRADGLQLDGTFSMPVFLLLDAVIVLFTAIYMWRRADVLRWILCAVTAVYTLGEVLGYPVAQFTDWDEFFLMLGIFAVYTQRWDKSEYRK